MARPKDFDPKKKYPVIEDMYAGPHDSLEAEKKRITKEIDKAEKDLKQISGKLSNPKFTERAPSEVVQENLDRK